MSNQVSEDEDTNREAAEARAHVAFPYFKLSADNDPDVEHVDDWIMEWRTWFKGWEASEQYAVDNAEPLRDPDS